MATIGTTITLGIALATTGAYASPLTIASSGAIETSTTSGSAIDGPGTRSWVRRAAAHSQ